LKKKISIIFSLVLIVASLLTFTACDFTFDNASAEEGHNNIDLSIYYANDYFDYSSFNYQELENINANTINSYIKSFYKVVEGNSKVSINGIGNYDGEEPINVEIGVDTLFEYNSNNFSIDLNMLDYNANITYLNDEMYCGVFSEEESIKFYLNEELLNDFLTEMFGEDFMEIFSMLEGLTGIEVVNQESLFIDIFLNQYTTRDLQNDCIKISTCEQDRINHIKITFDAESLKSKLISAISFYLFGEELLTETDLEIIEDYINIDVKDFTIYFSLLNKFVIGYQYDIDMDTHLYISSMKDIIEEYITFEEIYAMLDEMVGEDGITQEDVNEVKKSIDDIFKIQDFMVNEKLSLKMCYTSENVKDIEDKDSYEAFSVDFLNGLLEDIEE